VTPISPFRALRYDESVAGPLADVVAPPYDVLSEEERETLWLTSDNNIVHLTRPGSPEQAAETLAAWRESGVLREEEPALWWLEQEFMGGDGEVHKRSGIAGSIEATPYSEGKVLPHELTKAEVKEVRLQILRATRCELEPILLLYDADVPVSPPDEAPEIEVVEGGVINRLWRLPAEPLEIDVPFLIADGHHRYETAVAFREEDPSATHTFAVLVSSRDPGLVVFPTHRVAQGVDHDPEGFMTSTWDRSSLTMYRMGNYYRLESEDDLDTREIERYGLREVEYTPNAEEAVDVVNDELATVAFLVRPPSVARVMATALDGETMPPKSTYFLPKLTSGLLLHPV
jgi:uncharacterized protein (DUF1015 family)